MSAFISILPVVVQDHPGADWKPSPHRSKGPESRPVRYVVMHTVEGSYGGCISWFRNPKSRVSAHYVVGFDGSVTQMVRDGDIAWHAGDREFNRTSIGIEHEGYADRNGWTLAQYKASAAITRRICRRYRIPIDREHIISHQSITPKRRRDPGPHFDWDLYLKLVKGEKRERREPKSRNRHKDWWRAARTFEKKEEWYDAARYYGKIAWNAEEGEYVEKARARLAELRKDPEIRAAMEREGIERECRSWMGLGDTYRRAGLLSRCIPYYQRVIDVYPASKAAAEAAGRLRALRKD